MASDDELPKYKHLPYAEGKPPKTAWGLFGDDDNVGMFNLQTPERLVQAAKLVKTGAVFAMNWEQDKPNPPLFNRGALRHTVMRDIPVGHHGDDVLDNFFTQASSQWDALGHVGDLEHGYWGGHTNAELSADKTRLGIDHWARRGIAGRGVLLDVARHLQQQGRPIDCAERVDIRPDDLEATRRAQGVELQPGDVVLLRTGGVGWYELQAGRVRHALSELSQLKFPGLQCSEAMAEYLFDNHPAALASDNPALEAWPPPNFVDPDGFLHHFILGRFGIAIGEMFVLDALAEHCAADGTYEFLFTSAPLNIPGGTGSPPNALAIK
ncbi:MAG: cyclase family protein [Ilumatobacteraceae bacterium]|nr:cyclase family protein [Ilumatobacteraceae bacterium]